MRVIQDKRICFVCTPFYKKSKHIFFINSVHKKARNVLWQSGACFFKYYTDDLPELFALLFYNEEQAERQEQKTV